MASLLPIRFRTELARSFHRDIVNHINVPSGELNTLTTLDGYVFDYNGTEGDVTFSGADTNGRTLRYTPGRVEVFLDGVKVNSSAYTATNGTSITLDDAIGSSTTTFQVTALKFADTAVDLPNNEIDITAHGLNSGDVVLYLENGASAGITNLTNNTRYWAIRDEADVVALAEATGSGTGSGYARATSGDISKRINLAGGPSGSNFLLVPLTTKTFSDTIISTSYDRISIYAHGFNTGDRVHFYVNSGTVPGGLVDDTTYYVIDVADNTLSLATSLSNAIAGTRVNITSTGSGNDFQLVRLDDFPLDLANDKIHIPNHTLVTGDEVTYSVTGSTAINGLTNGTNYFIIKNDNYNIQLATSLSNANAGTEIPISEVVIPGTFTLTGPLNQTVTINTFSITNFLNPNDYFHVFLGRPLAWTNEVSPPTPTDTRVTDSEAKRSILGTKKINPSDVSLIVTRRDWVSGTVYAEYADNANISSFNFYVYNPDNYRIYKCLNNNNDGQSTVKPTHSDAGPKVLSDGYTWQLIYEVPSADRTKFLTTDYIPVKFYGTSSRFDHNGTVSDITITGVGSGYTSAPNVIILGDGNGATATASITPTGLLDTLTITSGGVGYSFAFVYFYGGGGTGASAVATLETTDLPNIVNQNVAGYAVAVNGQINKIEVTAGGSGYSNTGVNSTSVVIKGDGSGAAAIATVAAGAITSIQVTDGGTGYTYADISFIGIGTGATAKATISPQGGHGSNVPQELFATKVAIIANIEDFQSDFFLNNDFRQYGIIKNIKGYNSSTVFSSATGNGCYIITVPDGSQYNLDDNITTDSGGIFTVVYVKDNTIYLQPVINSIQQTSILRNETTGVPTLSITTLTTPEISQNSGDVIHLTNISPIVRTTGQTETLKFFINF